VPSWLRMPRRMFGGAVQDAYLQGQPLEDAGVVAAASSSAAASPGTVVPGGEMGFSILETPEQAVPADMVDKWRAYFAFDEREVLLGYFPGFLFRMLPMYGRLYVSTHHLCYKSVGPLSTKTRMIIPLRDILSTEPSRAFSFGRYGLVVIVRGHEELFLEFSAPDRRTAFVTLLHRRLEALRAAQPASAADPAPQGLEELMPPENEGEGELQEGAEAPAVMFTSTSSTFLTFKPERTLHFTLLTIGSRGDVQPYIALARGLMADGHRVRIATHGEFREWIESFGIEFGYVGGDPAELMRLCIENGTFTISFLKEGLQKFRGWIEDLLKTSWEACQNTDVLVESPSAMAGYHIAEALRVPYFRAFTMPWSRTRAYPHAFAVPERKMGGGYNYMTYVMFEQVLWRGTAGQINRWRRNTLGLPGTSLDKMEPHKIPFLYNFSPTVVPTPLDWPEWIRITGACLPFSVRYWFLDDADVSAKKWTPPPDLVAFIADARRAQKKVVYIGFGSIVVPDPRGMTRTVVEAIAQSGVRAILSKGWSDRLAKGGVAAAAAEPEEPMPKEIYQINAVPHDWLFRQIDAACHHGGAGTTGASLRAGIPTIIRPFFGDQFFWADRVETLGIGCGVRKLTVESLTDALVQATTDPRMVERARAVGEQIREENGVAKAVESLYRDMEYARSLVRKPTDSDSSDDAVAPRAALLASPATRASTGGPPSEDWSVISDSDDMALSRSLGSSGASARGPGRSRSRSVLAKRNSITSAMLAVLPDLTMSG
ncbi:hypothetical protein K488DRAFT_20448, partial [Vararia minispora EC-137]